MKHETFRGQLKVALDGTRPWLESKVPVENWGSEPCLLHASPVAHCFGSLHARAEKSLASQKGLLALRDRRTCTHLSIPKGFPLLKAKKKHPSLRNTCKQPVAVRAEAGHVLGLLLCMALCGSKGNTGMSQGGPLGGCRWPGEEGVLPSA